MPESSAGTPSRPRSAPVALALLSGGAAEPSDVPEGDTVHRHADRLRGLLVGELLGAGSPRERIDADGLIGRQVEGISARGKHLLITLSGDLTLHVHLGMRGRWRMVPGAGADAPQRFALWLKTAAGAASLHSPKQLEALTAFQLRGHPQLRRLGPDLLDPALDDAHFAARLRGAGELPLGVALLDQRLTCGAGNVHKSESCFLAGLDPHAPVAAVPDERLLQLIGHLREQLRRHVARPGLRRTTGGSPDGPRAWVYRRAGQPCLRCGEVIEQHPQGPDRRSTYRCPVCQP